MDSRTRPSVIVAPTLTSHLWIETCEPGVRCTRSVVDNEIFPWIRTGKTDIRLWVFHRALHKSKYISGKSKHRHCTTSKALYSRMRAGPLVCVCKCVSVCIPGSLHAIHHPAQCSDGILSEIKPNNSFNLGNAKQFIFYSWQSFRTAHVCDNGWRFSLDISAIELKDLTYSLEEDTFEILSFRMDRSWKEKQTTVVQEF